MLTQAEPTWQRTKDNPSGLPRTEIASLLEEMLSIISSTEGLANTLSAKLESITAMPSVAVGANGNASAQAGYRTAMGRQIGDMNERLRAANSRLADLQQQIEL